jgi:protease-4
LKQFLITVAGVLVALVIFLFAAPLIIGAMVSASLGAPPVRPGTIVLGLDLRVPMSDQRPIDPFASLTGGPALLDVLARVDAASRDDHVKGLYVRANTFGMAPAQAEELRAAIAAFRQSGKFVVTHLQSEGVRMSMAGYMAVAGADEIWVQEASEFPAMGVAVEQQFFADTLRRFSVEAQYETREEFKNAPNQFTERGFTATHREAERGLIDGLYAVMAQAIAHDRGVTAAAMRTTIAATPFTAARGLELKLADKLGRPEDAEAAALARAGDDAEILDIYAYTPPAHGRGDVIAVVSGEGMIISGPSAGGFGGGAIMNSDEIARALLDASLDEDVKAIVFRVSSPGGSVVASDQVLDALRTARERGKKVVVSMGDVAASGGYYVAAEADEIVASATTITGSIGVFGGKFVIGPALERYLGVRSDAVVVGSPRVTMFSGDAPFTPDERADFAGFIDRAYQEFLARVAAGRKMSVEQARDVARGRIWTGAQAKERGLVDHIGGFATAVARARALGGVAADDDVQLRFYPAPRSPLQALQEVLGVSAEGAEGLALIAALAREPAIAAAIEEARAARASGAQARLAIGDIR